MLNSLVLSEMPTILPGQCSIIMHSLKSHSKSWYTRWCNAGYMVGMSGLYIDSLPLGNGFGVHCFPPNRQNVWTIYRLYCHEVMVLKCIGSLICRMWTIYRLYCHWVMCIEILIYQMSGLYMDSTAVMCNGSFQILIYQWWPECLDYVYIDSTTIR